MDLPSSPLVLTKVRVPAARPRTIPRARLMSLLNLEDGQALVLVCAPAGYGKTTLLAEWAHALRKAGTAAAWFAIDPGDDDPIPFGAYLAASFIQALGPLPALTQIAQRLRTLPELDLQRILPELINGLAEDGRDCLLVLDDYHLVHSPAVHQAVAFLIEHLPEQVHIALGSRSDPPFSLARLRARRRLLEIRAGELRFTQEEAAQFLSKAMGLALSPGGIAALEARTEGWIAGLQLASLAIRAPLSSPGAPPAQPLPAKQGAAPLDDCERRIAAFTGSHRYLADYWMEEVFNRQPEPVRAFLLATSVLERMSAPLCQALLAAGQGENARQAPAPEEQAAPEELASLVPQAPPEEQAAVERAPVDLAALATAAHCQDILSRLESANLFVVALEDGWYRYHHLFRDFLLARLKKSEPGRLPGLHHAAMNWLAEHGHLREAAGHAFATRSWQAAVRFVEQHSFTLILHSEIATIYEWCAAFPEDVIRVRPMLCLLQGLSLAYSFRRQNRSQVELRLQQAAEQMARLEDRDAVQELNELAAVVRTFLSMAPDPTADPRELLAAAQELMGHYPNNNPGQFSALLLSSYAHMALLDLPAAARSLEAARQMAFLGQLYFGMVESTFHLARIAHHQGQLQQAVELCRQGQAEIRAALPGPDFQLPALGSLEIALGCALLDQHRPEEAEAHLCRGLEQMGAGMNPHYLLTAYLALFRLYERQGRAAEAIQSLDRLEAAWPDIAFCTRVQKLLYITRGAPAGAGAGLPAGAARLCRESPVEPLASPGIGPFGAAEAYYQAGLAWARLQLAGARTTGGDGLAAARAFVDRQKALAARHGLAMRLSELEPLSAELAAAARKEDLPESLTERELDVLRMMAQGATNQAIAGALVITLGTVKSHINHILGKLGAQNRTEAVAKAREARLLDHS